jgi:hypothetical protein
MRSFLVVVAVLLVTAPAADAKVWFQDMGGRAVRRGDAVSTTIMGCPGNESCRAAVEGVVVYVRRLRGAPESARAGRISGNGTLRFRVPHVHTGRYRLVAREGGRLVNASAAFSVRS